MIPTKSDIWWVDLPRRRDLYHGTTFSIRCRDKQCTFIGDIVTPRKEEHIISDKLKKSDCVITSIHQHPESIMATIPGKEEQQKESHIHFRCNRKSQNLSSCTCISIFHAISRNDSNNW